MANFDERSGYIPCATEWGQWWQTIEEVYVEINVPIGTTSKEIKCDLKPKHIRVQIKNQTVLEGDLFDIVHADDSFWTLEDKKLVRICLLKGHAVAENCWESLLVGKYKPDPVTYDQMEQKVTLQRFQLENPGFDFSGANITGNYSKGGPQFPSH